jgi:tRNA pseudouridine38-40 synthase
MVLNIVGVLIYVGKGKFSPDWIGKLLENGKRSEAAPTFSASGLYLAGVVYDTRWKLPPFVEPSLAAIVPGTNRPTVVTS